MDSAVVLEATGGRGGGAPMSQTGLFCLLNPLYASPPPSPSWQGLQPRGLRVLGHWPGAYMASTLTLARSSVRNVLDDRLNAYVCVCGGGGV